MSADSNVASNNATPVLVVVWTEPAKAQLEDMPDDPRYNGDKRMWHEERVRAYAQEFVPIATRARIRKATHLGGMDPNEPEHITVTFKCANRDVGVHHVYTTTTGKE